MLAAIVWSCVAISTAVFGVMIYSILTFRREGERAVVARHTVAEVLWATIPILILVLAAAPAIRLMDT
jgi:heme/copper-type cytochrome/quinol oxidase subunit 2